ncbi:MAG TPA: potassium channel family protein [Thermoplasmata archaeon]|nr:potassium channel family protein [Thermoplasmata archaeon]
MKIKLYLTTGLNAQLVAVLSTLLVLIATGTIAYRYLEGWSWINSFYFTVCTVTTVGYGDIVPSSDISRLFTALYALAGVALALASLGLVGTTYITNRQEKLLRSARVLPKTDTITSTDNKDASGELPLKTEK